MRKLVVIEFITLDGSIQGLGSPDEVWGAKSIRLSATRLK